MESRMSIDAAPSWRVLLIGGTSGVGKTVATRVVAQRLGVSHLLVDDVRMAIQRMTSPAQQPALFYFFQPDVWSQPPEALLTGFIGVAQALAPALEAIIAHHVGVPSVDPVLIEGDGIAPSLAATTGIHDLLWFGGSISVADMVRAVYVDEPSEDELLAHMLERGRGFDSSPPDQQQRIAHACWRYGQWLTTEARARGVPVVSARPFASLPERIIAAAHRGEGSGNRKED